MRANLLTQATIYSLSRGKLATDCREFRNTLKTFTEIL